MHYFIIWCSAFMSLVLANPVFQRSEESSLDQEDAVYSTDTVPVATRLDCNSDGSWKDDPENDLDESPNLVRRRKDACAVTAPVEQPNPSNEKQSSPNSSDVSCDDPKYNVLVSCGGAAVILEDQNIDIDRLVLNCEQGNFLYIDSNDPQHWLILIFRLAFYYKLTLAMATSHQGCQLLLSKIRRQCKSHFK